VYAPENPNTPTNPRIFRESLSTVYSKMMQWFNSIGCEAIIIDQVGNLGGEPDLLSIAEFMGANRQLYFTYNVFKEPQRQPINYPSNSKSASASKNLVDRPGKPVSPFTFNIDWGGYFLRYSEKQLSMLRQNREVTPVRTPYSGTSGSNALPISFEQTVFPDFG